MNTSFCSIKKEKKEMIYFYHPSCNRPPVTCYVLHKHPATVWQGVNNKSYELLIDCFFKEIIKICYYFMFLIKGLIM